MNNPFQYAGPGLIGPAVDIIPITPDVNGSDLTDPITGERYVARALLCRTAGDATIVTIEGATRAGVPLSAGINPIGARRVLAFTGTGLCGLI